MQFIEALLREVGSRFQRYTKVRLVKAEDERKVPHQLLRLMLKDEKDKVEEMRKFDVQLLNIELNNRVQDLGYEGFKVKLSKRTIG